MLLNLTGVTIKINKIAHLDYYYDECTNNFSPLGRARKQHIFLYEKEQMSEDDEENVLKALFQIKYSKVFIVKTEIVCARVCVTTNT